MKRLQTSELIPGMITAEDIYNYTQQLILPKGITLTDRSITKLEFYSIASIRVEDAVDKTLPPPPPMNISYSTRVKNSLQFKKFEKNYKQEIDQFRNTINDIVQKSFHINPAKLLAGVFDLTKTDEGDVNVFDMLHNLRSYDDLTFAHSINVALICKAFAEWLHLTSAEIELATLSGLLHDIGKLTVPDDILKKPSQLTLPEFSIIKKHTTDGYQILEKQPLNIHIKNAALMHHERCDGSGYPLGLIGAQIDFYAKIVSIADVYDAMTAARVYRGPMCPFQVISLFESEGLQKYDPCLIMTFLERIATTYLSNRVRLSNGLEGDIVFINKKSLAFPTVNCHSHCIDLSTEKGLSIIAIL